MNQSIPRIIQELLSKEGHLEGKMRKTVEDAGFHMFDFNVQYRGTSFAVGCKLVLLRNTSCFLCFAFSQAERPYFKGVIPAEIGSSTRFMYHKCTYEEVSETVLRGIHAHITGCKNETTALEYFGLLAQRFGAIKAWRLSTPEEDSVGIDIVVSVQGPGDGVVEVPIQVKSSSSKQTDHRRNENRRHIPSIAISKGKRYQNLVLSMKDLLMQYVTRRKVLHI